MPAKIASAVGLAEQLAPDVLGRADLWKVRRLLVVGPEFKNHVAGQLHLIDGTWSARPDKFLSHDQIMGGW